MVDGRGPLGGVCLNVGCIPSKALLHAAKVIAETKEMSEHGVSFAAPTIDLDALRSWKDGVVTRLTGGLTGLAKKRKVTTVVGTGTFTSPNMLEVNGPEGTTTRLVRLGGHRRGLRADRAAVRAARRSPCDRLDRGAGPDRHPRAAAGARRRDHRAGDGMRVLRARKPDLGRGADGPDHSRRGQGPGHPARQADRQDLRPRVARYQGHRGRGRPGRVDRLVRRLREQGQGQGARDRGVRQSSCFRRTQAQRQPRRRGRRRGVRRRARVRPGRQAAAHERLAHLRDRRRRRAADAGAQGHSRGQGRRGERRGHTTASSTPP